MARHRRPSPDQAAARERARRKPKPKPKHGPQGHPVVDEATVTGAHPAVPKDMGGEGPPPAGGGGPAEAPPNDLGIPDLPPEIAAKIHDIFTSGYDDAEAQRRAISYLMGTDWFKTAYAGFDTGFANGMFSDPLSGGLAQYRQYKKSLQQTYRTYYNRDVTVTDITTAITNNWDTGYVERQGQGYGITQSGQVDWQYLSGAFGGGRLSDAEKKAYGEELAGIDTPLGQSIKAKVDAALQRMQGVFQGTVAGSALGDQQLGQRLTKKPDIQA